MRGKESTGIQLDPAHGWERPLPEKLMIVNFVAQTFFGFSYGMGLFFVNALYPDTTQWLTQHLSAVTDPVARYLPIAIYADKLAYPQLGLSAMLIRHVFSFLMLISLVPGVIFFGLCHELAVGYGRSLKVVPKKVKQSLYVFAFLSAIACLALFVGPVIKDVFNSPVTGMDSYWYLFACVSPACLFFSVPQVVAIAWAYCMRAYASN